MSKYSAFVKNYFQSAAIKRADFFVRVFINLIQVLALVILWTSIYETNESLNGYTLETIILYYCFVLLISQITQTDTVNYLSRSIKDGTLSEWLLKPRNILLTEFSRSFGNQLFNFSILLPLYIVVMICISFTNLETNFTLENILCGLFFAFLGFIINYLLEYTIAIFAFWMDKVWSLKHFKDVITQLLGGKDIPVSFFPPLLLKINNLLPFRFIYFIPLEYFLNLRNISNDFITDILNILIWIFIFLLMSSIFYKLGIKRYGAFGN